jgi:hypothetical protein
MVSNPLKIEYFPKNLTVFLKFGYKPGHWQAVCRNHPRHNAAQKM